MIDTAGKTFIQVAIEIAEKLIEQGGRCRREGDFNCVYGDGHGSHCAIGWLFPEDSFAMEYEGGIGTLLSGAGKNEAQDSIDLGPNSPFLLEHIASLCELQDVHDSFSHTALKRLPHAVQVAFAPWMALE